MKNDLHFSSKNPAYETPPEIFLPLNEKYNFTVDLAANAFNKQCPKFIPEDMDSLEIKWHNFKGWLWLNPPYGRGIKKWVEKCHNEAENGANIIALLPSRTDTIWFHDYIYNKYRIDFLKGRIRFFLDGIRQDAAPFPSMLVYFSKTY